VLTYPTGAEATLSTGVPIRRPPIGPREAAPAAGKAKAGK